MKLKYFSSTRSKSEYTRKLRKLLTRHGYVEDDVLVINLDEMKAGDTLLAHLFRMTGQLLVLSNKNVINHHNCCCVKVALK